MAAGLDERVPEALQPIAKLKWGPNSKICARKPFRRRFYGEKWPPVSIKGSPKLYNLSPS